MLTNSHFVHLDSFQKGVITFPDRYSYRFMNKRKNDYLIRMYFHMRSYLDAGKMIFFDTLTYDDFHLPHVSDFVDVDKDFACFNPKHLKVFLDRLHSRMAYYNYPSFTHFICSEYGKDDLYVDERGRLRRGTKRPHYHILLFLEGKIDPISLGILVHECWNRGRTDNYNRTTSYINHNTFIKDTVDEARLIRLSNYLSKYVLKDAKFSRKVDKFCYKFCYRKCLDSVERKSFLMDVASLRRKIGEFVLISNGFGLSFLDSLYFQPDNVYDKNMVCLPDVKFVKKYYKLPEYYERKLFYECVRGQWKLNDKGKEYLYKRMHLKVANVTKLLTDVYLNCDVSTKLKMQSLMDGRSWNELAVYSIFYRGRIYDLSNVFDVPSVDVVVDKLRNIDDDDNVMPNEGIVDIKYYHCIEPRYLWLLYDHYHEKHLVAQDVLKRTIKKLHWKDYIIDDSYFPAHYGFDEVLSMMDAELLKIDLVRQGVYDKKEYLELVYS